MKDEVVTENGTKAHVPLEVETANGIRYAVATLDESRSGEVSKSHLQAVVANISSAIKTPFVSDDLDSYLPEKEKLTVVEFLDFLESRLLVKGKKLHQKEIDQLSWVVVGQKYEDDPHLLTKDDAFKLWLAFKKLDISGALKVDVEELCIVLEKFVRGIGVQWNEQMLTEYAEDGAVSFWKFIDCLERKFLIGVDKSVLREGLQDLYESILDEVIKTGFLYKKGHSMIKSIKSRWFVLKPERLAYYVSQGYREKKGEIVLNNEAKVVGIPDKGSNKCRFMVTCGQTKKDYEQTAPDQRTKQAWMTAIQTTIDCYGGQTPLKRELVKRKAKRDADKARKAEEEKRRQEQEDLLSQQRQEIDLLKQRKAEIERLADEEKAMLDAEIRRREELEELQRNLQQLLEDQKRAREEEEKVRAAKERLLEEERQKREQLETLRMLQQQELQEEKMQKEELMERQKEQERVLDEERKRLQHLEEERIKAEEAAQAAQDKLNAAETAAKNAAEQAKDRVRQLKTSIGLKGTVGPKVDPLVTHRGKGAFTLEEFLNRATDWSGLKLDDEDKTVTAGQQTDVNSDELVKASATPATNQNIPEFLKKAAAWSGLNPDTYLETTEEKNIKTPPKVASKPLKPSKTEPVSENVKTEGADLVNGEVPQPEEEREEGSQAEKVHSVEGAKDGGSQEEVVGNESVQETVNDEGPVDTELKSEVFPEEVPMEKQVEDEGSKDDEVESVVPKEAGMKSQESEEEEVKNEEPMDEKLKDEGSNNEKTKNDGSKKEDVQNEGSQVEVKNEQFKEEEMKNEVSQIEEAKNVQSEVELVKHEGSMADNVDGEVLEAVGAKNEESVKDVEDGNPEAAEEEGSKVDEVEGGGSEVELAKDEGTEVTETKDKDETLGDKNETSQVQVQEDDESKLADGKSEDLQVSCVDNEGSMGDQVKNESPEVEEKETEPESERSSQSGETGTHESTEPTKIGENEASRNEEASEGGKKEEEGETEGNQE